ncbi:cell division protein FtsQ/DivIB [Endozoicomonas sp.]|nr:cell division protein FtsQ/DivIB [Endozoicomonas sp.]
MLAFCLVVVVIICPKLWSWLNQPITRVEVHAPFIYVQRSQIESLLGERLNSRFFQLDLSSIRELLLVQPWLKEASLRKEWPDRLIVSLEEKEPVARWYNAKLISTDGGVFMPLSTGGFERLPVLKGSERQAQAVMQQYLAISQLLRPLGLVVSELELGRTGAWSFKIGGVQVNIGKDQRMERLQRFVRLYHAQLESKWKSVKRIDLRYPNGASVAWGNG